MATRAKKITKKPLSAKASKHDVTCTEHVKSFNLESFCNSCFINIKNSYSYSFCDNCAEIEPGEKPDASLCNVHLRKWRALQKKWVYSKLITDKAIAYPKKIDQSFVDSVGIFTGQLKVEVPKVLPKAKIRKARVRS